LCISIIDNFVNQGSVQEINIPDVMRNDMLKLYKEWIDKCRTFDESDILEIWKVSQGSSLTSTMSSASTITVADYHIIPFTDLIKK
jgi:hypothetical protein